MTTARFRAPAVVVLSGIGVLAAPRPAAACGNVTHTWITLEARVHLPAGPLRELLEDPELEPMLRNGSMFPDGGYAIGDDYGEMAHWEPFQDRYIEWIRDTYAPPWPAAARPHIAFLFGMASHGMADQVYDASFLDRSRAEDAEGWAACGGDLVCSFDTATDVFWAELYGEQPVPDLWIPGDVFVDLYAQAGHTVSAASMEEGSTWVGYGMDYVGGVGDDPDLVAPHRAAYPWAASTIDDRDVRASPGTIPAVVAGYWEHLWRRLHGETWTSTPVVTVQAGLDGWSLATSHTAWEARVVIVFSRGLAADLGSESFALAADAGVAPAFTTRLFYRGDSHVVLLTPESDWAPDTSYTLTVLPGVTSFTGVASVSSYEATFSTAPPPPEPEPEPTGEDDTAESSGCAGAPPAMLAAALALAALLQRRGKPVR